MIPVPMNILIIVLISLIVFFGAVILYDTHRFVIREYTAESAKIGHDCTICLLSDLHGKVYGGDNSPLLDAVREIKPDLILCAGDMISAEKDPDGGRFKETFSLIGALRGIAPVFLANGNHEQKLCDNPGRFGDLYERYARSLNECGAVLLRNRCEEWENGIDIAGFESEWEYYRKINRPEMTADYLAGILGKPRTDRFRILIAHNPTFFPAYADQGADLVVSGHYHGGIMRLPVLGGVISPMLTFFPAYDGGCFKEGGSTMVVSRGLGTHTLHVRVFNPGELVVIRLKKRYKHGT